MLSSSDQRTMMTFESSSQEEYRGGETALKCESTQVFEKIAMRTRRSRNRGKTCGACYGPYSPYRLNGKGEIWFGA